MAALDHPDDTVRNALYPVVAPAALLALLDQPGAGTFAIDLFGTRHVVPRRHLPAFSVHPH